MVRNNTLPDLLDQAPPHDIEAERAVLGCILLDPEQLDVVTANLTRDDFYCDGHRRLFDHITCATPERLRDRKLMFDWLIQAGDLQACGGAAAIGELYHAVGVASHAQYYASAIKQHAERRRLMEKAEYILKQAANPTIAPQDLADEVAAWLTGTSSTSSTRYELLTPGEVTSGDYNIEFLCEPILVKNQPAVIGGPSKTLKTSVAVDLAISIATATKFLNKFWVPQPSRVAMFSAESGMGALSSIISRVCADRMIDPAEIDNLLVSGDLPRLDQPEHLGAIRNVIKTHEIDVAILDPLYLLAPTAKSSSLHEMGQLFREVNQVVNDMGATLVLIHHSVKRPGFGVRDKHDPPEREDLHGAGVTEWARQWLQLGRRATYEAGSGHHELWLSVGGSAGHGGLWALDVDEGQFQHETRSLECWDVSIMPYQEAKQSARDSKTEQRDADKRAKVDERKIKLLTVGRRYPEGAAKTRLRDEAGLNDRTFAEPFGELLDDGLLEPCKYQVSNQNTLRDGYRLTPEGMGEISE